MTQYSENWTIEEQRKYCRKWRQKNKSKKSEYDKKWRLEHSNYYKKYSNKYMKEFRLKYPKKIKACGELRKEIKSGKIKRQPCVICGNSKSEGHHNDYSKPLEVLWLCKKHHAIYHTLYKLFRTPVEV